ncbi:hypothetical protein [Candidatus Methylobacter oryzae]|uniref:Uncharacterized protein n=1 Tax=Candidatus Methylobacter oryzae TaxID=2497749 RepID=A0ABY3C7R7_9GAMM|nr:hypothetical protein [Candidatus Methylobacter oryzae]TRW89613.1 hypothetical protein EKO24_021375 [Candidatus Methylobacter oryzae]
MKALNNLLAENRTHFGAAWSLPEYRQVELYTKRKKLPFSAATPTNEDVADSLGLHVATLLLESFLASKDAELMEGLSSWQKYLALPRTTASEKMVAEVYRILRLYRIAAIHRDGHIEVSEGLVRMSCTFKRCALSLNITPAGLALLASFVHIYLDSFRQPYGEAYVELQLLQYFLDIVAEIRKFADEDRVLYQFRPRGFFNRHFRLDCDNPRYVFDDGRYRFDIGALYADPVRYPIDFFVVIKDILHIVPVEALKDGAMPEADLHRWQAREPYRSELPPEFRQRFGRETMVVGLPMT